VSEEAKQLLAEIEKATAVHLTPKVNNSKWTYSSQEFSQEIPNA
jgi:hypothetical protein